MRHDKGFLLITSLLVLTGLATLMAISLSRSMTDLMVSNRFVAIQQAFSLAEAGLDSAMQQVVLNPVYPGTDLDGNASTESSADYIALSPGSYRTIVAPPVVDRYTINAWGLSGSTTRRLQVVVERVPEFFRLNYAIFANTDIGTGVSLSGDNALTDSYDSAIGPYGGLNVGSKGTVATNTNEIGAIFVAPFTTVKGDAWIGPGPNDPSAAITGSGTIAGEPKRLEKKQSFLSMAPPVKPTFTATVPESPSDTVPPGATNLEAVCPALCNIPGCTNIGVVCAIPPGNYYWPSTYGDLNLAGSNLTFAAGSTLEVTRALRISGSGGVSGINKLEVNGQTSGYGIWLESNGDKLSFAGTDPELRSTYPVVMRSDADMANVKTLYVASDSSSYAAIDLDGNDTSIAFTGADTLLYTPSRVRMGSASYSPSVSGLKMLYAGGASRASGTVGIGNAGGLSFNGAGSMLYTPGNVVVQGSIAGLETLYAGSNYTAGFLPTPAVEVAGSGKLYFCGPATCGSLLYTPGNLSMWGSSFPKINDLNKLYTGLNTPEFPSSISLSSSNAIVTFAGDNATVYTDGSVSISDVPLIEGMKIFYVGSNSKDDATALKIGTTALKFAGTEGLLYVKGSILIGNLSEILGKDPDITNPNPIRPQYLFFYVEPDPDPKADELRLKGNSTVTAAIYAPQLDAILEYVGSPVSDAGEIFGWLVAQTAELQGLAEVHYDESLGGWDTPIQTGFRTRILSWQDSP